MTVRDTQLFREFISWSPPPPPTISFTLGNLSMPMTNMRVVDYSEISFKENKNILTSYILPSALDLTQRKKT
jgi:hypothetical protein